MQNNMTKFFGVKLLVSRSMFVCFKLIFFLVILIAQVACSSLSKARLVTVATPQELRLQPQVGRDEQQHYYMGSLSKTYADAQLRNEKEEVVDFRVNIHTDSFDLKKGLLQNHVELIDKDGTVDLNDMAFPEMNEVIIFDLNLRGEVLKASDYPADTIFYVPSISLPSAPVRVGDTWEFSKMWRALRSGMPMQLDMVTIVKGFYQCSDKSEKNLCALLDISGEIHLPQNYVTKNSQIQSKVWGKILFSVQSGLVVWSEIRNQSNILGEEGRAENLTCLESLLEKSNEKSTEKRIDDFWDFRKTVKCKAEVGPVKVPGID